MGKTRRTKRQNNGLGCYDLGVAVAVAVVAMGATIAFVSAVTSQDKSGGFHL